MKKLLLLSLLAFYTQVKAQNVGIGNPTPTEKLDVTGNIKVTGELKPTGLAGLNGQVLTSNGDATMRWGFPSDGKELGYGPWGPTARYIEAYQPFGMPEGQPNDYFGSRVAMDGNYAVVSNGGNTVIFKKNPSTFLWEQKQIIEFGASDLAISGDHLIIGNAGDLRGTGSVSFYSLNPSTDIWEANGKFYGLVDIGNPSHEAEYEYFGSSVAISGNAAIVGAPYDGFSSYETEEFGSATFFYRDIATNTWGRSAYKFRNENPVRQDQFGSEVSISENFAFVGCPEDDPDTGTDALNNYYWGSINIYKKDEATGHFQFFGKIFEPNSPNSTNRFGRSISADGDYFMTSIRNGIYFFKYNATTNTWEVQVKMPNNGMADSGFGNPNYISGDLAIVGAKGDNLGLGPTNTGTATIYRRVGTVWQEIQKFNPPHGNNNNDNFGASVAIEVQNKSFIVGTPNIQSHTGLVFFGEVK